MTLNALDIVEVPVDLLRLTLEEGFVGVGLSPVEAHRVTDALIDAELARVPTHGLLRVPQYLDALSRGAIARYERTPAVQRGLGITVRAGGGCFGHLPTWEALDDAGASAHATGLGLALVHGISEFGRAGYYAAEAGRRGFVALICQNTMPLIAPPGGTRAVLGNNPLAFSGPGPYAPLFDAAFTPRSHGELRRRQILGLPLEPEWGYLDSKGELTTSADEAVAAPQQAIGGAKGFGLAIVVDALAGVLAGAASSVDVEPWVAHVGAAILLIDPAQTGATYWEIDLAWERESEAVRASGGRWPGDRQRAARRHQQESGYLQVPRRILSDTAQALGCAIEDLRGVTS